MKFKYVITSCTDPYRNLAVEQYLFRYVKKQEAILYLWQNEHVIVIGKNQNPYAECRLDEFTKDGGRLARRKSGGGAVYHDLGNCNFSIISTSAEAGRVRYQDIISEAVSNYGLSVSFNGRNDLLVNDKKFSGNACYDNGQICCQHGTLLVNTDIAKMTYYLTPDKSKLERNHIQSVSSRVLNLSEVNAEITVDSLREQLVLVTNGAGLDVNIDALDLDEEVKFFSSREWLYGGAL